MEGSSAWIAAVVVVSSLPILQSRHQRTSTMILALRASCLQMEGGKPVRDPLPLKVSDVQRGSISFPARSSARDREDRRATARSPDYRLDGEKEEVKSSSCFPLVNTRWDVSSHVNAMHGFFSWAKPTNHGPNITDDWWCSLDRIFTKVKKLLCRSFIKEGFRHLLKHVLIA